MILSYKVTCQNVVFMMVVRRTVSQHTRRGRSNTQSFSSGCSSSSSGCALLPRSVCNCAEEALNHHGASTDGSHTHRYGETHTSGGGRASRNHNNRAGHRHPVASGGDDGGDKDDSIHKDD